MDVPMKVYVTCPLAELKQVPGTLIAVSPHGFYEINVSFGALLPSSSRTLSSLALANSIASGSLSNPIRWPSGPSRRTIASAWPANPSVQSA